MNRPIGDGIARPHAKGRKAPESRPATAAGPGDLAFAFAVALALAAASPASAMRTSANFIVEIDAVSGGGIQSTSPGFQLTSIAGQSTPGGTAASTSFALLSGYVYQVLQAQSGPVDTDNDGMPDAYETANGLNPLVNDANLDPDNDGLTNLQEFQNGTLAQNPDTDADQMPDGYEVSNGLNPLSGADALTDLDNDGFNNLREFRDGTDPRDPGSNIATHFLPLLLRMLVN